MKLMPWYSSGRPNVKRAAVCTGLKPTVENRRPEQQRERPLERRAPRRRPPRIRAPARTARRYSTTLNNVARPANGRAKRISMATPNSPPIALKVMATPSARSYNPRWARWYRSSAYAADAGVPGMRTSALGMSPAEIAHASRVTTAASAASGERKYVSGTMSATAMVADSPGIDPKIVPYMAAEAMTARTVGSRTWPKASTIVCPIVTSRGCRAAAGPGGAPRRRSRPRARGGARAAPQPRAACRAGAGMPATVRLPSR